MKKNLLLALTVTLFTACQNDDSMDLTIDENFVVTGSCGVASRTSFGTPNSSEIPYSWSAGDYIWLGNSKSSVITEDCATAQFEFKNDSSFVNTGHIFYNMTGQSKSANVLSTQTADGNLGNDGDFGCAALDRDNSFILDHKTAYITFDTKSSDSDMPKLISITLATEGVMIAGNRTYNFEKQEWDSAIENGTSTVTLNIDSGYQLKSENEGIMAAMVVLPAEVAGTKLNVTYTFDDGSIFTEEKSPSKNFTSGTTQHISSTIMKKDLVKEPNYELRILTFEDNDTKFEPYECEFYFAMNFMDPYVYKTVEKWSDYIPRDGQYGNGHGAYEWYDYNNTELAFVKPTIDSWWGISGHAGISDYVGTDKDIEQFDDDNMLFMIDLQAYNVKGGANGSKNFCSQYGYLDPEEYATQFSPNGVLPGLQFHDGVARVIDHMYVTNTSYTYKILVNGEKDFGGSYEYTDDCTFKVVAYGYDSMEDTEPTTAEFYLLNKGKQIITDWTKWDLSSLGKVVRVEFNLIASDSGYGIYGNVIPAYFAYDDVAVRFEK